MSSVGKNVVRVSALATLVIATFGFVRVGLVRVAEGRLQGQGRLELFFGLRGPAQTTSRAVP